MPESVHLRSATIAGFLRHGPGQAGDAAEATPCDSSLFHFAADCLRVDRPRENQILECVDVCLEILVPQGLEGFLVIKTPAAAPHDWLSALKAPLARGCRLP